MDYCRLQKSILNLKGITSSSQFTISNTHPQFALTYSILLASNAAKIQIFPHTGTILPEGKQIVRIKCLEWNEYSPQAHITVESSMGNEKRNNPKVWNQIVNSPTLVKSVIVKYNSEKSIIQNQIKESILLAKTFGDSVADISSIDKKQHEQIYFEDQPIFSSLKIESNAKKNREREQRTDIQYYKQISEEKSKLFNRSNQSEKNPFQGMPLAIQTPSRVSNRPKIFNRNDIFFTEQNLSQTFTQQRQINHVYEVILLAIVAALFVVLGSRIKHIFT